MSGEGVDVSSVAAGMGGGGGGGDGVLDGLKAGDSATLICNAKANPPAYNFTFMFNVSTRSHVC